MNRSVEKSAIRKTVFLSEEEWVHRSRLHEQRISEVTEPWLEKRSRQEKDPVLDFLFEYYPFRVAQIKRWSPGIGIELEYSGTFPLHSDKELTISSGKAWIDAENVTEKRLRSVRWILDLLVQTSDRKPHFGCFGMHEWAMVYRSDEIRHSQIPLRLPQDEIDRFVESRPLLCTHYDAFRFFTEPARPMNRHQPNRSRFVELEQSGCIHTNMDLYKWAFRLYPLIEGELLADTFLNAVEARRTDMQASPYDASHFGLEPIPIETEEGRKIYLNRQMVIHEKSAPLRLKLIDRCRSILQFASSDQGKEIFPK